MRWLEFRQDLDTRIATALEAADAVDAGHLEPARALLRGWRFVADTAAFEHVVRGAVEVAPRTTSRSWAVYRAGQPALDANAPPRAWRRALETAGNDGAAPRGREALACTLENLSFWGEEIDAVERGSWPAPRRSPGQDEWMRGAWEQWFHSRWLDAETDQAWKRLFENEVRKRLWGVIPRDEDDDLNRTGPIVGELTRSAVEQALIGVGGELAAWRAIAARIVSSTTAGPFVGTVGLLDAAERDLLVQCAATHRLWSRARVTPGDLAVGQVEALLDRHVAGRLLVAWGKERQDIGSAERIVAAHRDHARGRVRALLAWGDRERLGHALVELPGLFEATREAIGRWAYDWAWRQVRLRFPGSASGSPKCTLPEVKEAPPPRGLDPEKVPFAHAFVLLAVLRDRLGAARRWVTEGSVEGRDHVWEGLLAQFSACLADEPRVYARLRQHLRVELDEMLEQLVPVLSRIAALDGENDRAQVVAELKASWPGDGPPLPRKVVRFPLAARVALETLHDGAWLELP